eukprot:7446207-Alexandrium_andersonii.AAC.1
MCALAVAPAVSCALLRWLRRRPRPRRASGCSTHPAAWPTFRSTLLTAGLKQQRAAGPACSMVAAPIHFLPPPGPLPRK